MGQKTQPIGFRLGINRTWDSRWFGGKSYGDLLHQDIELRKYLFEKLKAAAVSKIVIERPAGRAKISIYAGRPGLVIGKKGQDIETLKNNLSKQIGAEVSLNIIEKFPSNSEFIIPLGHKGEIVKNFLKIEKF